MGGGGREIRVAERNKKKKNVNEMFYRNENWEKEGKS